MSLVSLVTLSSIGNKGVGVCVCVCVRASFRECSKRVFFRTHGHTGQFRHVSSMFTASNRVSDLGP